MGFFKNLSILIDEGDRDAMLLAANICRENNKKKAILLYEKLGRYKEAQELRDLLAFEVDEDVFG